MKFKPSVLIFFSVVVLICLMSSCSKSTTPSAPGYVLSSPANNTLNVNAGQAFTCLAVSGVTTYHFVFTDVNTGLPGSVTVATNSTTATNLVAGAGDPTSLISGHTYTWYVQFNLSNGNSVSSSEWSFSVQ